MQISIRTSKTLFEVGHVRVWSHGADHTPTPAHTPAVAPGKAPPPPGGRPSRCLQVAKTPPHGRKKPGSGETLALYWARTTGRWVLSVCTTTVSASAETGSARTTGEAVAPRHQTPGEGCILLHDALPTSRALPALASLPSSAHTASGPQGWPTRLLPTRWPRHVEKCSGAGSPDRARFGPGGGSLVEEVRFTGKPAHTPST